MDPDDVYFENKMPENVEYKFKKFSTPRQKLNKLQFLSRPNQSTEQKLLPDKSISRVIDMHNAAEKVDSLDSDDYFANILGDKKKKDPIFTSGGDDDSVQRIISFAPNSEDWFKQQSNKAVLKSPGQITKISPFGGQMAQDIKIDEEFQICYRPAIGKIEEEKDSYCDASLLPNVSDGDLDENEPIAKAGIAVRKNSDQISIRPIKSEFLFKEDELLNENSQKFEKMIKKRGRKSSTKIAKKDKEAEKKKDKKKPFKGKLSNGLFAQLKKKKKVDTSLNEELENVEEKESPAKGSLGLGLGGLFSGLGGTGAIVSGNEKSEFESGMENSYQMNSGISQIFGGFQRGDSKK